jgi:hypothetical protein
VEQRIDRLEDRVDKLEDEVKKQGLESVRTEVYVKEIYKKMDAIAIALESMRTTSGSKWETFFAKALWVVLGVVGSYVATKINFK